MRKVSSCGGLTLCLLILSGCAWSPWAFNPPKLELPAHVEVAPVSSVASADQHFNPALKVDREWWTILGETKLNALIKESLLRHPTIESAEAAILEARADLEASTGQLTYPQVNLAASAARSHINSASTGGTFPFGGSFNLLNASLNVSYTPDLFGSIATSLQGLGAKIDMEEDALDAARLNIASNIAMAAVKEAALRAERDKLLVLIQAQEDLLELTRQRQALGAATETDRLAAESAVESSRLLLPPVDKSLAQNRHLLLSLSGQTAGGDRLPTFMLEGFHLPRELPEAVPSELLRTRPDIRSAEAAMRVANAEVGVADANLYPSLSLTGSLGGGSNRVGDLLTKNASLWNFGASLLAPVFNAGSLKAKKASAEAAYRQVKAQYRDTVISAFQSVADVLAAMETDRATLLHQEGIVRDAEASYHLSEASLDIGAGTRQQVLSARINLLQAEMNLMQPQANRLLDTVMFYQALGGPSAKALSTLSSSGSSS